MRTLFRSWVVLGAVATGMCGAAAHAADRLVVVELFTSQGCSSCPPAHELVKELSRRDDILALSFHVDYWNYIGWKDPFSSAEATKRQKGYGRSLNKRYVYTPQIVIDGEIEVAGSELATVEPKLKTALRRPKLRITVEHNIADGVAEVRIPAGHHWGPAADVWVALYDNATTTDITAGENKGMKLSSANVVRVFQRIAGWRGQELKLNLPLVALGAKGRDACAIIVQRHGFGPILGATTIALPETAS